MVCVYIIYIYIWYTNIDAMFLRGRSCPSNFIGASREQATASSHSGPGSACPRALAPGLQGAPGTYLSIYIYIYIYRYVYVGVYKYTDIDMNLDINMDTDTGY